MAAAAHNAASGPKRRHKNDDGRGQGRPVDDDGTQIQTRAGGFEEAYERGQQVEDRRSRLMKSGPAVGSDQLVEMDRSPRPQLEERLITIENQVRVRRQDPNGFDQRKDSDDGEGQPPQPLRPR